jgi:hypothetical protein
MVDKRKREIRARMAATGESYLRAARTLDRGRRTGVVQGYEDLADPTAATVRPAAQLLINLLQVLRPEAATRACIDPAAFTRAIDGATAHVLDLEDQLAEEDVDELAVRRATALADYLVAAQRLTEQPLTGRVGSAVADGHRLARAARAARLRVCTLGDASEVSCGSDARRIRLRLYDTHGGTGHTDTEPGCVAHAVEEWARLVRHPRVAVEVIGPPEAAQSFHAAITGRTVYEFVPDDDGWAELDDHFRLVLAQHDTSCVLEATLAAFASGHDDEDTVHQVAGQFLEGGESACRCS